MQQKIRWVFKIETDIWLDETSTNQKNILKAWLSCNITWDSNCCPIVAHRRFGGSCNFRRLKSRHAIHHCKFKHDDWFKIRRLIWRIFRWRRRILWWLIHHGKLILTRKNITAYTVKQTPALINRRLHTLLIGPYQGHPYPNQIFFWKISTDLKTPEPAETIPEPSCRLCVLDLSFHAEYSLVNGFLEFAILKKSSWKYDKNFLFLTSSDFITR